MSSLYTGFYWVWILFVLSFILLFVVIDRTRPVVWLTFAFSIHRGCLWYEAVIWLCSDIHQTQRWETIRFLYQLTLPLRPVMLADKCPHPLVMWDQPWREKNSSYYVMLQQHLGPSLLDTSINISRDTNAEKIKVSPATTIHLVSLCSLLGSSARGKELSLNPLWHTGFTYSLAPALTTDSDLFEFSRGTEVCLGKWDDRVKPHLSHFQFLCVCVCACVLLSKAFVILKFWWCPIKTRRLCMWSLFLISGSLKMQNCAVQPH